LLVAQFAGELPPDVALAVREHIAVCATCGTRSRSLYAPYELISSLGETPVEHVPDLRDGVRARIHSRKIYRGLQRMVTKVTRGSALGALAVFGFGVLVVFVVTAMLSNASAVQVDRSSNTMSHPPVAGPAGSLLAETNKLVTVQGANGDSWQVTEVVVVSEKTGAITSSLPASSSSLQLAQPDTMPVATALSPDGKTIYEVTAPNASHQQALVAFDMLDGNVKFASVLKYPGGRALVQHNQADALSLSLDGNTAYIGLNVAPTAQQTVRVLVVNTDTGKVIRALKPGFTTSIPMPAPPGSLPASAFPDAATTLDASHLHATLGANGGVAVSPDGASLFDVILLSGSDGSSYGVVRRFNAQTGDLQQELALPGDYSVAALMMSNGSGQTDVPQLYLVRGGSDAACDVIDPGSTGPTLIGDISLGGPGAPTGTSFTGSITISPSVDANRIYISQHVTSKDGAITGNDIWDVDTSSLDVLSHRIGAVSIDGVQGNIANSRVDAFVLHEGKVDVLPSGLTGDTKPWLTLNNGQVVRLLGIER
jgi:hypothetical protein